MAGQRVKTFILKLGNRNFVIVCKQPPTQFKTTTGVTFIKYPASKTYDAMHKSFVALTFKYNRK